MGNLELLWILVGNMMGVVIPGLECAIARINGQWAIMEWIILKPLEILLIKVMIQVIQNDLCMEKVIILPRKYKLLRTTSWFLKHQMEDVTQQFFRTDIIQINPKK